MFDVKFIEYLEQFVTENRRNLFKQILNERTRHFTVAIEDISQPHNASAVVRSCDVFGVQDIHVIENSHHFYASNKVAKGAQKWLNFELYNKRNEHNTLNCIANLKNKGYQIIATTPHNDSGLLNNFDISKKTAFFFGDEANGLSNEVLENADGFLKIPMVGFTESLNISVAAAIVLQHVCEKLKNSSVNWQLSTDEKSEIYEVWLQKSIKNIKKVREEYAKIGANLL
jgi:tRNA (guanosine-2'-O-)-methyltransferase